MYKHVIRTVQNAKKTDNVDHVIILTINFPILNACQKLLRL